jgi:uncharacterized protein (TIGR03663 family)
MGTILLLPLLSAGVGRTAIAASAILMALSPAMVFYSRMYIQEALFACFALAFVVAVGRVAVGGRLVWAIVAGAVAGLAIATKETAIIVLPAALVASAVAWWSLPAGSRPTRRADGAPGLTRAAPVAALTAAAVAAVFYSSFLTQPAAVAEPFRALATYVDRGIDPANHAQPWHYYLSLLAYSSSGGLRWSEGVVLVLALVGIGAAWQASEPARPERAFWTRSFATYAIVTVAVLSAIRYKTPWNVLPFFVGVLVLAGVGFSLLVRRCESGAARALVVAVFAVASAHLAWQAWRASVTYAADPRNPYVYAQTVPDAVRMAARIRTLAALHPDGDRMRVSVIAGPYEQWPLPWSLRAMPHVGYWTAPGDALALRAPVIVASLEHTAALDAALGDRYLSEFHGLRPDVLLVLYIERGLWDRFMAAAVPAAASAPGRRAKPTGLQ